MCNIPVLCLLPPPSLSLPFFHQFHINSLKHNLNCQVPDSKPMLMKHNNRALPLLLQEILLVSNLKVVRTKYSKFNQ